MGLDKVCDCEGLGDLCADNRLFYFYWTKGGKGRVWGNCVLSSDCVIGIG